MKTKTLSRSLSRWAGSFLLVLASLTASEKAGAQDRSKNPQYGMAHRVNTAVYIFDTLDGPSGAGNSAATGIEFDIYYHSASSTWIVTHGEIVDPGTQPSLQFWLQTLGGYLDSGNYDQSFASLYVDVKTPNSGNFADVMNLVRQYIPTNVAVIYALNDLVNFQPLPNGSSRPGYNSIKTVGLLPNEGVSCWATDVSHVRAYYDIIKRDQIERAVVDHGNFVGTDEDILREMNHSDFHNITDPYRFKKTIAWTYNLQNSMENYMDPDHGFHVDSQLVGAAGGQYLPLIFTDLDDFDAAIATHGDSQRKADRTDFISFWERSGSDYVTGDLVHVNNVDAGALQTGAKWEAFGTVTAGVNRAIVNAANPPPRIVISTKSNYNASPASTYSGGARIDKRCRLEKFPGVGSVRISQ